jgi:Cft2 family RNA processing exonuclease
MPVYNHFRAGMAEGPMIGKERFDFNHIQYLKTTEELDDSMPCVVLAAPAMLQSGMSQILFDKWESNPLDGVIIPGYVVDNTLATRETDTWSQIFQQPSSPVVVCSIVTKWSGRHLEGNDFGVVVKIYCVNR